MLGVFLDRDSVDRGDLDFSSLDNVIDDWQFYGLTRPDDLVDRIQTADIIISNKVYQNWAFVHSIPFKYSVIQFVYIITRYCITIISIII